MAGEGERVERPILSDALTAEEFAAWYWLKEELVGFCRVYGVRYSGKKREIEGRIADFLAGLGSGFRFNAAVREFIHTGKGKRLGDVRFCQLESAGKVNAIPEQLEYNRHFRRYFREHPGATRAEAIAAWWVLRGKRRE